MAAWNPPGEDRTVPKQPITDVQGLSRRSSPRVGGVALGGSRMPGAGRARLFSSAAASGTASGPGHASTGARRPAAATWGRP